MIKEMIEFWCFCFRPILYIGLPILLLMIIPVLIGVGMLNDQRAEMQRVVYERQGIHMTKDEIRWGCRPIYTVKPEKEQR